MTSMFDFFNVEKKQGKAIAEYNEAMLYLDCETFALLLHDMLAHELDIKLINRILCTISYLVNNMQNDQESYLPAMNYVVGKTDNRLYIRQFNYDEE